MHPPDLVQPGQKRLQRVRAVAGAGEVAGAPKPLSESEVEGQLLQDAIGTGMIGPKDAADVYRSGINIEQVIGADIDGDGTNDPVNVARGSAIGRQPFINPGSAPAPV